MTDNTSQDEKDVREILEGAEKLRELGRPVQHLIELWSSLNPCNPVPSLSVEECRTIAINYPYSFDQIRVWFPAKIEDKE